MPQFWHIMIYPMQCRSQDITWHPRNNPVKFAWNWPSYKLMVFPFFSFFFSFFFFFLLWCFYSFIVCQVPMSYREIVWFFFSIFSIGGHFVQQSRMVWAILVENLPKSLVEICPLIMEMLFEVCLFFLFLALAATLCSKVEWFEQYW